MKLQSRPVVCSNDFEMERLSLSLADLRRSGISVLKVYLLAKDVRKSLGYKSVDQLQSEHSEIVKHIKDFPALVLESDFNTILTSDIEAMKKLKHKDVEDAGVDLLSCNAPGISFYISQAEVIKLLNPNMYRDIVLIDGDMDFVYSKTITNDSFIE